jgi:antitoxin CptB
VAASGHAAAERLSRLRWRCRRGMRELDLLLEQFLAQGHDTLGPAEQVLFERLLDVEDDLLYAWFYQGVLPDDGDLQWLVGRISAGFQRPD